MDLTNKIQDAFDNIKADARLKESTKQFLYDRRTGNRYPRRSPAMRYAVSMICVVLILAAGAAGYSWVRMPVSYVSIDVNPSIELGLNRFDRVVSAKAYNAEGEAILDELSLKWKRYTDALHAVIECEGMRAYLADGEEPVLAVAADQTRGQELEQGVRRCSGHMRHHCQNVSVDLDMASQAHHSDLSVGKYYAYLQLSQYDSSVTVDDCREMSMVEINARISEYEQTDDEEDAGNTDNESGYDGNTGGCNLDSCDGNGGGMPSHQRRHHHRNGGHE